jgi:serine/threonine protein kinase
MPLLGRGDSGFESLHPDNSMEGAPKITAFEQETLEDTLNIETHLDSAEFDKRVQKFCVEVLNKENKIDDGNFANVFVQEDEYPGLCFKKLKPLREPKNSVHEEGKILDQIKNGVGGDVRTPMPYVSAEQFVKHENGRIIKRRLLVMERIDGITLRDIIEPVSSDKKQELPENFNIEDYFTKLRTFFTNLHDKYKIYHRDVNIGNLMIQSESLDPAVIDFGESFWGDSGETEDAYGRAIIDGVEREDIDLKKLADIEQQLLRYIDKNNI